MQKSSLSLSSGQKSSWWKQLGKDLVIHKTVYLLFLPILAWYVLFKYMPLRYLQIAFMDYNIFKGIQGSNWVGFKHFMDFFSSFYAGRLIRNTILLSVYDIIFSFPAPILLALMINEVNSRNGRKIIQTISYMPHFISIMVICGMIRDFSASSGLFNQIGALFGAESANLLANPRMYRTIHIGSSIWQGVGWSSIIYLATISTVDPQQYEAAYLDGANILQRMVHVTLPALIPIITVQFIMRLGNIMSVGYQKIILLYNSMTYETADVISTYLYRTGILSGKYSVGAAVGLFNTVINIVILIAVNKSFSRFTENSLW
jgi:putative aldouronate transport system permease protein